MREVALSLGPDRNLVGVATVPDGLRKSVAVLLLNAGVVHRIGPHRIHVKLARYLARRGYMVVRFDVSGVGDSRASRDSMSFREQASADIGSVIDYLEREHSLRSCALFGICAGAANAYQAALADERVAGVFLFDGYAFPTLKGRLIQYYARLRKLTLRRLPASAVWHASRAIAMLWRRPADADNEAGIMTQPTRSQFAKDVQAVVDRGVRVTLLFSGSVFRDYAYPSQFRDAFKENRFISQITCCHATEIDHVVTSLAAQRRLAELVDEWLSSISAARVLEEANLS